MMSYWQKSFWGLFAAVVCGYMALGATFQGLPSTLLNQHAVSLFGIAATIGLASFGAAFSRPIAGRWADRGYSNQIILLGCVLGLLGGLAHHENFNYPTLLGARVLLGASEGFLFTGAVARVISVYPPEYRAMIAGWFGLAMWGGLLLGAVLVSQIQRLIGNNQLLLWRTVMILLILALCFSVSSMKSTKNIPTADKRTRQTYTHASQRLRLFWPGCAFSCASFGYGSINAALILMILSHHLGGEDLVLPLFSSAFFITRILGSLLFAYFKGYSILLGSLSIECTGLLVLSMPTHAHILIGSVLSGIGISLLYPGFVSLILSKGIPGQEATNIGRITSCWDIGLMLAAILSGVIATTFGFQSVFQLSALFTACAIAIISIFYKDKLYDTKSNH